MQDEDTQIIEAILGIHLVNDFEVSLQDKSTEERSTGTSEHGNIRGLFALNSMPNHDCLGTINILRNHFYGRGRFIKSHFVLTFQLT